MIRIFLLVLALLSHIFASSRISSTRNEYEIDVEIERGNCRDPRDDELMKKLSQYKRSFENLNQVVLRFKSLHKSFNDDRPSMSGDLKEMDKYFSDQVACNSVYGSTNRSLSWAHPNQLSLCPLEYVVKHRQNKYPRLIIESQCLCRECNSIQLGKNIKNEMANYGCRPLLNQRSVLVRGACMPDGFYQWTYELEAIAEACVCGKSSQYTSL